jgi:processive 1,2-diacylglycerol beta-glucosyltransferase
VIGGLKMKVLFLSDSTGGGHTRAAEAVAERIRDRQPDAEILIADSLKIISPLVDRLIVGAYLNTVKNTPNIYGKLYDLSEKSESISDLVKYFNRILSFKLLSFIQRYSPSVIVCTHTIPLQMLSNLKSKGRVSVPVIGIVTDFVNHSFWKLKGVDAFIVAHDYIKIDMIKMGIPNDRIYTFGIPVSGDFLGKKDRDCLLRDLGLQNKLTFLLMGGSLGFEGDRDIFASLLKCGRDMQIIALAGRNEKLKNLLEKMSAGTKKSVRIMGYTDIVSDLMEISDFIITKPGGMTISEALVKRLPILINSPIPGQEVRNARFLVNMGAAVQLTHNEDMDEIFHRIINNPIKIRRMQETAAQLAKPRAGEDIAALVERIVSACSGAAETDIQRDLTIF